MAPLRALDKLEEQDFRQIGFRENRQSRSPTTIIMVGTSQLTTIGGEVDGISEVAISDRIGGLDSELVVGSWLEIWQNKPCSCHTPPQYTWLRHGLHSAV